MSRTMEQHGHRYWAILAENWEQTECTQGQAALVLGHLDNVLEKLPEAIAWCVLTHNLWLISRMALANELEQQPA